jgi:hypothetical protein
VEPGEVGADVGRTVHHDASLAGAIVDPALEAVESQRIAVLAHVGIAGHEESQARSVRIRVVREVNGHVLAGARTVRDELLIEQPTRPEIEDPQPLFRGRSGVVDDGQRVRLADLA